MGEMLQLTQSLLFREIWLKSDKRSFVSGLFLRDFMNTRMFYNCFAHVLAKGQNKYPYFKYYAKNIVLLSPDEHHLYDHGSEEQRINYAMDMEEKTKGRCTVDWDKLKRLEEELKGDYQKHFPRNKGLIIGYKYSPDEVMKKIGKLNREYWEEKKKGA